jgi:hypothetical protein
MGSRCRASRKVDGGLEMFEARAASFQNFNQAIQQRVIGELTKAPGELLAQVIAKLKE